MHLAPPMLMLSLLALSPSSCTPEQIDSFCIIYNKVIVQKGDGKIVASDGVKRRLLANELLYKEQCLKGT
jgi:hypothetical protein